MCPRNTVVEHLTHIPKIETSNPAIRTGREIVVEKEREIDTDIVGQRKKLLERNRERGTTDREKEK
jgi:hypothetical protein